MGGKAYDRNPILKSSYLRIYLLIQVRVYTRYGTVTLIRGKHTHTRLSTLTLNQTQTLSVYITSTLKI